MIIFDFDQTLVDTSSVEALRQRREWKRVMAAAPKLPIFSGVTEMLLDLANRGETLGIVTHSPDMVPRYFIEKYKWPIEIVIGPHQVRARKPNPGGIVKALQIAGADAETSYHVGDRADDTGASKAAGVISIGVTWGISDDQALRDSAPDHMFSSVAELHKFLVGEL